MNKTNTVGRKYVAINNFSDTKSGDYYEGGEFEIMSLEDYGYVVFYLDKGLNERLGRHELIYDVETFHNNVELKDKILDKWESLGFLENLLFEQQIKLAHGMEYTAETLIADGEKEFRTFNEVIDTIIFPILRRLVHKHELSKSFIDHLLIKVKKLTESSVYDMVKGSSLVHAEAELINYFIELNYDK
tara:strand:- start:25795 stop:26358 length:564 start_codon:yes stop_codon:yes gene_type:complete